MRILFGYPSDASFIRRDLEILKTKHQVVARNIHHKNPFRFFGDLTALLGSQLVFFWFAGLHTIPLLLAAIALNKKIVYVVGGYEAANMPEMKYGQARPGLKRHLTRLILLACHRILAVSDWSLNQISTNLEIENDRITLLHHGFDDIASEVSTNRKKQVVTVGSADEDTFHIKGIAKFIEIAEAMPSVQFIHVGRVSIDCEQERGKSLPANLKMSGQVPYSEIAGILAGAKVYLQLSKQESFGCAVAEAMICGCIPVVSGAGALAEVVGDCGIIVESDDPKEISQAVERALEMPQEEGLRARRRILDCFSREGREKKLLKLIMGLEKKRGRPARGEARQEQD